MDNRRDRKGGIRFPEICLAVAVTYVAGTGYAQAQAQPDPGVTHPTVMPDADIDWAGVAKTFSPEQEQSFDRLDGFVAQQRAFDATALPILMPGPRSGISLSRMTFSSFGDAYGMALPQPRSDSDVTIVITASRSFIAAAQGTIDPGQFDTLTVGGQSLPATIEPTEDGWTASFERYGALYSVDIDCGNQGADSPCKDSNYIRQVVYNLDEIALGKTGQDQIATFPPTDVVDSDNDRMGPPDRQHWPPVDRSGPWRRPQPRQEVPKSHATGDPVEKPRSGGLGDWLKRIFHQPPTETPPKSTAGAVNGREVR